MFRDRSEIDYLHIVLIYPVLCYTPEAIGHDEKGRPRRSGQEWCQSTRNDGPRKPIIFYRRRCSGGRVMGAQSFRPLPTEFFVPKRTKSNEFRSQTTQKSFPGALFYLNVPSPGPPMSFFRTVSVSAKSAENGRENVGFSMFFAHNFII